MFDKPVRRSGRLRRAFRRCSCGPAADPRWDVADSGESCDAIRTPSRTGRSWISASPASGGRRSSSSRSPPSTSSSFCSPGTAACTGWKRRLLRTDVPHCRCTRSSRPGSARPHARVACVDCHIGEGAKAFVHAKLGGVRQLVAWSRPIPIRGRSRRAPTCRPGAQAENLRRLSPAGTTRSAIAPRHSRVRRRRSEHRDGDVLQMHVGGVLTSSSRPRHPLARRSRRPHRVRRDRRRAADDPVRQGDRRERPGGGIPSRRMRRPGDSRRRAATRWTASTATTRSGIRSRADARAGASNQRHGRRPASTDELPFARREGVRLVKASYPSQEAGERAIDEGIARLLSDRAADPSTRRHWRRRFAPSRTRIAAMCFPTMKVTFGSYPDQQGARHLGGCFRCHDDRTRPAAGRQRSALTASCATNSLTGRLDMEIEALAGRG